MKKMLHIITGGGSSWRLPTLNELIELTEKCTWVWTIQNGIKGMKISGVNGNSIFLPAASVRKDLFHQNFDINGEYYGSYWSASPSNIRSDAYVLGFGIDFSTKTRTRYKPYSTRCYYGSSIRPVTK